MLNAIKTTLSNLRRSDEGATLVEYGVAILLAVTVGAGALITMSDQIGTNMGEATTVMQERGTN